MLERKRNVLDNTADNFDPDGIPSFAIIRATAEIAKYIVPSRATVQRLSGKAFAHSNCIHTVSVPGCNDPAIMEAQTITRGGGSVAIVPKIEPADRIKRVILRGKDPRNKGFSCNNVGTAFRLHNDFSIFIGGWEILNEEKSLHFREGRK
jgi:hypothetical protein